MDTGKVQGQNVEMGVDDTLMGQNEMVAGGMQMARSVKDYTGKGKEDEHMNLNLDVNIDEEVDIEKEDIEKVGIEEEELDDDIHMAYGTGMKAKNHSYPSRNVKIREQYSEAQSKLTRSDGIYPNQTTKFASS